MRVMKFGGTSVGSANAIRATCKIVQQSVHTRPVVVVSALSNVTNDLIEIARTKTSAQRQRKIRELRKRHERTLSELRLDGSLLSKLFGELETIAAKSRTVDKRTLDRFMSFGERFSARIIAACLENIGVPAHALDAWEMGLVTDDHFGSAEPLSIASRLIKKKIKYFRGVPVVTGFIGKTRHGDVTTLGRGGSDYTAAIIGAAIKADVIQIWKEVDGILSADPRIVPEAKIVSELAFEEASELAYFGAKVLHPKTILPAMKAGVPVQVLNTFKPRGSGTTIVNNYRTRKAESETVEALTFKKNNIVVHIMSPEFFDGSGLMAAIFNIFSAHKTSIDLVTTSVASVSLTFDNDEHLQPVVKELSKLGDVVIDRGKAIICAVGGSLNAAGVAGRMFTVLGANQIPVELISQASSGYSMTFVVNEKDAERALRVLHKEFIS